MVLPSGNPFAENGGAANPPPAATLVIFGGTGDLAQRKLLPALYDLACDRQLPDRFVVLGISRKPLGDEGYRNLLEEAVRKHARRSFDPAIWSRFAARIFYDAYDITLPASFTALRERLSALSGEEAASRLYYLATAPRFFGSIAEHLKAAGLIESAQRRERSTSVIVEKPFGRDLASARALNATLRAAFREDQIFRIDHYLAKETIQNILVFRFANSAFEPFWNGRYIDHIQIAMCERIGIGGRADYFERNGLLRDIVQNHLLQVLALLCIEAPVSLRDPEAIRDEKVKVLRSIKRMTPAGVRQDVLRGQYQPGFSDGQPVPGYREEAGNEASRVETYTALRLEIDNWRWAGVPIYMRAGKRLPKTITEIAVFFKQPPAGIFSGMGLPPPQQNVLTIEVQPRESISLRMNSKPPGMRLELKPVEMEFTYQSSFGVPSPDAYERLLLDVMRGDASLFTRDDEIEQAWDVLLPILSAWTTDDPSLPLHEYEAGSWGPRAARELLRRDRRSWRRL